MERKFECIKPIDGYMIGAVADYNEKNGKLYIKGNSVCSITSLVCKEYFKEITPLISLNIDPRIRDGQEFNIRMNNGELSCYNPYHFEGFKLINCCGTLVGRHIEKICKGEYSIELITKPTEKEKLEQEMRELEKKMGELADRIKGME